MDRALLILRSPEIRKRAHDWVERMPDGTRVEFKGEKRTLPQNNRMWTMLTDIASQATLDGKRYSTERWKAIFLHALGQEIEMLPALDGQGFIPYGARSSDLSKREMSDLMELMSAWGAQNGVVFHDPAELHDPANAARAA